MKARPGRQILPSGGGFDLDMSEGDARDARDADFIRAA